MIARLGTFVAVFIAGAFAVYNPPAKRMTLLENRSWKFIKQDISGAQTTGFSDAS
jgi:hypothetical protein